VFGFDLFKSVTALLHGKTGMLLIPWTKKYDEDDEHQENTEYNETETDELVEHWLSGSRNWICG
jgi:hypothetical protein